MKQSEKAGVVNAHEAYSKNKVLELLGISQKFWDKLLDEGLPFGSVGRWFQRKCVAITGISRGSCVKSRAIGCSWNFAQINTIPERLTPVL